MKKIEFLAEFLKHNPTVFLATFDNELRQSRVRPITFRLIHEKRFWFYTFKNKDVYQQIIVKAPIEIAVVDRNMTLLRITTTLDFHDNLEVKKMLLESNSQLQDSEDLVTFYFEHGKVRLWNRNGQNESWSF